IAAARDAPPETSSTSVASTKAPRASRAPKDGKRGSSGARRNSESACTRPVYGETSVSSSGDGGTGLLEPGQRAGRALRAVRTTRNAVDVMRGDRRPLAELDSKEPPGQRRIGRREPAGDDQRGEPGQDARERRRSGSLGRDGLDRLELVGVRDIGVATQSVAGLAAGLAGQVQGPDRGEPAVEREDLQPRQLGCERRAVPASEPL